MAYRDSYAGGGFGGGAVTPWVKRLLIANAAVFVVAFILANVLGYGREVLDLVAFGPTRFVTRPWTLVTYAFVHLGIGHILGNLLVLFFFGPPLEERWGSRAFIRFYLVSAAGAALFSALFYFWDPANWIIGASGATFGLMLAFAMIWPEMEIHVWGIFPIKAKWLVGIMAFVELLIAASGSSGGVATLAHLGGMVTAFLYLKSPWAPPAWGEVPAFARKNKPKRGGVALVPWSGKKPEPARTQAATATQVRPANKKAVAAAERELLDDVDRILDKISSKGLGSLTEEERRRLDEVSRRYRTN
ncbi:MAG TPA: rhomboid family intramembrane serine protease [Longimicrobium sp.]|jgi:membrane associated rhomboid family serine protease|uniref:rhomboid family intramembrane serine protease n=1 Tax=Longimicrobium sp. TaxID=2029185 RepID=UPI002ED98545